MSDVLTEIYNRMHSAEPYRPGSTTIFDDMTLEAGDTITIESDGNTHKTLLSTMDLTWNGNAMVGVNSQGQEKRESLSRMSQRKYNGTMSGSGGGSGYRNTRMMYTQIVQNNNQISLIAEKTGIDGLDPGETLTSRIDVVAGNIQLETQRATNAENSLSGRINVQANKVSIVVSETAGGYEVNRASIVAAINQDGGSSVDISADKVNISGDLKLGDVITTEGGQSLVDSTYLRAQTAILHGLWVEDTSITIGPASNLNTASLQTITIDGTVQTAKFLGTAPLSFSVADTEICQTLVSAAGTITKTWSGADVDNPYNNVLKVKTTADEKTFTVTTRSSGWTGISEGHYGTCEVFAVTDNGDRAVFTVTGLEPYTQGFADGGGGVTPTPTPDVVVTGRWSGTTYRATNNINSSYASTTVSLDTGSWIPPDRTQQEPENQYTRVVKIQASNSDITSATISASSVYDIGKNSVVFSSLDFNPPGIDNWDRSSRQMVVGISNGKSESIPMQLTWSAGWNQLDSNAAWTSAWLDTAEPGTSSYHARMRLTIPGQIPWDAGYAVGLAEGTGTIDITRGTRTGINAGPSPSNAVQIWKDSTKSPPTAIRSNGYYSFKVTCGNADPKYYYVLVYV